MPLPLRRSLLAAFVLLAFTLAGTVRGENTSGLPATCYLFAYFLGSGDGLHLAWSTDGLSWKVLNEGKCYLKSTFGRATLRDPDLSLGPDHIFHLVWTDSGNPKCIGYADSKDLITWSNRKELPVMESFPTVKNSWAPILNYDASHSNYQIVWSSTVPGAFPETDHQTTNDYNHRFYVTTTTDFSSFTPTTVFFDPGFSAIDATILQADSGYYLIFKNETDLPNPQKTLQLAYSDLLSGPYTGIGPLKTYPPSWVEGPTAIKIGHDYVVYYDCYTRGCYGAIRSHDLNHWEDLSPQLCLPEGARHGSMLAVPSSVITCLLNPG